MLFIRPSKRLTSFHVKHLSIFAFGKRCSQFVEPHQVGFVLEGPQVVLLHSGNYLNALGIHKFWKVKYKSLALDHCPFYPCYPGFVQVFASTLVLF